MRFTKLLLLAGTLTLAACGGYSAPSGPSAGGADVLISIGGNMNFSPGSASVKVGQTVAWYNADSITHTATADKGSFDTGNLAGGATSAPIRMSSAGSFSYHCTIHPNMVGTLSVTQ